MNLFKPLRDALLRTKYRVLECSFDNLLWLVNIVPSAAGFSIRGDKISAPFWILHISLLFYVYALGSIVFQVKFAQGPEDFIKSYVNVSLLILTANNSYWFLTKRPLLKSLLKKIHTNDKLAQESVAFQEHHKKLITKIKYILLIFYGFNLTNASFIYLPHRVDVHNDYYAMTPCVGLEPLTSSPNREVCLVILCVQEFTIMTVVLNYQALLLFFIAHTSVMYQMLAKEMMTFNTYDDLAEHHVNVKKRLPFLIERHVLTLDVINNLKSLYSVPIGVNFASNAVCISLFFYLPLQEWLEFIPILVYCFLVFFLYCFLCQRLIDSSELFERAVYSCGWENFNLNEKKSIYVMLRQSQKPVLLLAADIIPVNIYTFATTLQAMFKFVTVVKF